MTTLTAKVLADFTTSLATALAIGATTATLQSATDDDGVALPSGTYYFTLDGANSSKEHIRCSLSGTSLTSVYSISRQGVATSGTVRAHRLGATVTLTDFAHIKVINDLVNGTTALDSANPLKYDGVADMTGDTNKLASVKYVNDTSIAGAPDSSTTTKGIVKMSTAPASATEPIAVGTNDNRVPSQDENDALVGTSGTPSSSNKYVTNDDTTGTGSVIRSSVLNTSLSAYFGDGNDGTVTWDGSTTILGMAPAANVYTLTRDVYINIGTINNGVTINTGGYRMYFKTSLTNNGTIQRNGNNATNASGKTKGLAGAALASGTLSGSVAGVDGTAGVSWGSGPAAGVNGVNGNGVTKGVAASGTAGGNAGGSGTGGTAGSYTPSVQGIRNISVAQLMTEFLAGTISAITTSSGSGSGAAGAIGSGAGDTGGGGGSGSPGGIVWVAALTLTNNGTISANGGNGGNGGIGTGAGYSGGGGGSGAGGVVVLISHTLTLGTVTANAGTAGAGGVIGGGAGAGSAAATGNAGVIYNFAV